MVSDTKTQPWRAARLPLMLRVANTLDDHTELTISGRKLSAAGGYNPGGLEWSGPVEVAVFMIALLLCAAAMPKEE